ncbi:MAG: oligosaccharide flippase family protein [Niabella sp.]
MQKGTASTGFMNFGKYFFWYFLSTVLSTVIGLIKSPIFTDRFSPENFGYYSLVFVSYTFLSIVFLNWTSLSLWRFYHKAKSENKLPVLYITLGYKFGLSCIWFMLIAAVALFFVPGALLRKLVIWGCFFMISNVAVQFMLAHLRIENKAKAYNVIVCAQAIASFLLLLYLTLGMGYGIETFFASPVIVNLLLLLGFAVYQLPRFKKADIKQDKTLGQQIVRYGQLLIWANLSLSLLSNVDRYLVQFFKGAYATGIYNQLYMLGQMLTITLIQVFFSTVNPGYTKMLEFKPADFSERLSKLVQTYLVIYVPIGVYAIIFAQDISTILLRGDFVRYYYLLPPIVIGNILYGLTNFFEIKLKFEDKRKKLFLFYGVAVAFNVLLNAVMLSRYSFEAAAYVTMATYLLLFVLFYLDDLKQFLNARTIIPLFPMFATLALQILVHLLVRYVWPVLPIWVSILEGILFVVIYILVIKKKFDFSAVVTD